MVLIYLRYFGIILHWKNDRVLHSTKLGSLWLLKMSDWYKEQYGVIVVKWHDENSPFRHLKHLLIECSRNVHRNQDFRYCSETFQWVFSPTKHCWITSFISVTIHYYFFNFQGKKSKLLHQRRGFKIIWLLIMDYNALNGGKSFSRSGSNPSYWFFLFLNLHVTSTTRCFIFFVG